MGLSIHYKGRFRICESLPKMIEEVKDIAETYKWDYHLFEKKFPKKNFEKEDFNENIYGILFSPPKCEPVMLCFLSNGIMANPFMLDYYLKTKDDKNKELIYATFTKTQYAGIEIHKIIIHFMRYISEKYLHDFSMIDEGKYWETGDEQQLEEMFSKYKTLVENFTDALENSKTKKGETLEEFILKIAEKIRAGRK